MSSLMKELQNIQSTMYMRRREEALEIKSGEVLKQMEHDDGYISQVSLCYVCIGRNTNLTYRCLSHSSSCYIGYISQVSLCYVCTLGSFPMGMGGMLAYLSHEHSCVPVPFTFQLMLLSDCPNYLSCRKMF